MRSCAQPDTYFYEMNGRKPPKPNGFGHRVRTIRKRKGITQTELAKMIGSTQRAVCYYENETGNPSMEIIEKIALALAVPKRALIDDEDFAAVEDESPKPLRTLIQSMKIVGKLPPEDQRFLVKTIETLAHKNGLS